jgi:hypothetical protein
VNDDDLVALADCCAAELLLDEAFRLLLDDFEAFRSSLLFADVSRLAFAEFDALTESLLSAEAFRLAVRLFELSEDPEAVDEPFDVPFEALPPLEAVRSLLALPEVDEVLPLEPVPVLSNDELPLLLAEPFGPAATVFEVEFDVPVISEEFDFVAEASRDAPSEADELPVLE